PHPLLAKGKVYIVYMGIADHARRAATANAWGAPGPAYILGDDGMATYRVNLQSAFSRSVLKAMYRRVFLSLFAVSRILANYRHTPVAVYVALIKRARQLAEEEYDGAFILVFGDDNEIAEPAVKAALDKAKIAYIPVTAIIPDLLSKASIYRITPMDG